MSTTMTPSHSFGYTADLAASEKVNWRVEDLIGGDKRLDFKRRFLPESLARVRDLGILTPSERLLLNQIRGHGYLRMFGLVEEFIHPFVLDHARPQLSGNDHRVRALLQFASEEAKHVHLFKRFGEDFVEGFGSPCDVIGPAPAITEKVLSHQPLAVALTILHIEWMTQRHYVDSVKDKADLDPQFKSLLKHHWMEEAQHAKLDALMVEALAEGKSEAEIQSAVDEYLEIGMFLDQGLAQQAEFDADALQRVAIRTFSEEAREELVAQQHQAQRWTYLGTGMTHVEFLATLESLSPSARRRIEEVSPTFC